VAEEPEKLLYRIYRDTRFSKDKTPYKTHIAATFPHRRLGRHSGAGFYIEVSHKYVGIAGGIYMPGPEELRAIRDAIAKDGRGFLKVVEGRQRRFGAMQGEKLKRMPKDWEEHVGTRVEAYLKFKQFYWWVELPAKAAVGKGLEGAVVKHFEDLLPAIGWFNKVLVAARREAEEDARPERPEPMW
jgi:uncharacterized protein (TIGR02453 family)